MWVIWLSALLMSWPNSSSYLQKSIGCSSVPSTIRATSVFLIIQGTACQENATIGYSSCLKTVNFLVKTVIWIVTLMNTSQHDTSHEHYLYLYLLHLCLLGNRNFEKQNMTPGWHMALTVNLYFGDSPIPHLLSTFANIWRKYLYGFFLQLVDSFACWPSGDWNKVV